MSEQTTTEQTTAAEPEVVIPDSPLVVAGRAEYANVVKEANELYSKVQAAENVNATIAEIRNTSEDARIVEFRKWLEQANAAILAKETAIDEIIKAEMVSQEPIDLDATKATHKLLVKKARDLTDVLKQFAGEAAVHGLEPIKSVSGRAVSGTSGTGGKRPRLQSITVNGADVSSDKSNDDGTVTKVASFTVLAQWMTKDSGVRVEPKDLQQAAFTEAKTDDLSTLAGKPVSFPFTVNRTKDDGTLEFVKTYAEIVIVPKVADK